MQRLASKFSRSRTIAWVAFVVFAFSATGTSVYAGPVMGAKKSKVYHTHPKECSAAKQINDENVVRWPSEEEARKEGRRLCKTCEKVAARDKKEKPSKASDTGRSSKRDKAPTENDEKASETEKAPPTRIAGARVKKTLPGGTLQLEDGEKVRPAGIIVPQSRQPLAEEAVRFIQKQLKGRKVQLEPIVGPDEKTRRDAFGRMIAYITAGSGDSDLGGELITEGLAAVDRSVEFDRLDDYLEREDDAAWADRGIWKKLDGPDGEIEVVAGKHTHEYHSPDCLHVVHLIEPATITINDAKGRRLCPCEYFRMEKNGEKE